MLFISTYILLILHIVTLFSLGCIFQTGEKEVVATVDGRIVK